jgi:DNA (cytosine-5)-methyltransferase 1
MQEKTMKKIIDIFCGCGGLSLGLKQTNEFISVCAIDVWQPALDTIKTNNKTIDTICDNIKNLSNNEIFKIKNKYGDIELVVGGPPCQGFSLAGKREIEDERNNLWKEFVRFVSIVNPNWFIFENVFGLISMQDSKGEKIINKIISAFENLGYYLSVNSISAKDYNVPQDRKRIIIIGSKKINISSFKLSPTTKHNPKTVRDSIGDLEELESAEKSNKDPYHFSINHHPNHIKWLKPVPEGESAHNYKHITGMTVKGYSTTYKRIWWDKPSPTITTCFSSISSQNNVHPKNHRALTIREACRLQTFPDDYIFRGTLNEIRTQIGNAVPPELARQIGLQILNISKNNDFVQEKLF